MTEAWVSVGKGCPCLRAYGLAWRGVGRLRAAKAALVVHFKLVVGGDELWYLGALLEVCLRTLRHGVEEN